MRELSLHINKVVKSVKFVSCSAAEQEYLSYQESDIKMMSVCSIGS